MAQKITSEIVAAPVAPGTTLAVLPFASNDPQLSYGLAASLRELLALTSGLRVVTAPSDEVTSTQPAAVARVRSLAPVALGRDAGDEVAADHASGSWLAWRRRRPECRPTRLGSA